MHGPGLLAADLLSVRPALKPPGPGLIVRLGERGSWALSVCAVAACWMGRGRAGMPAGPGKHWPWPSALGLLTRLAAGGSALSCTQARAGWAFSWAWWGVHFWLRLLELTWALTLALAALAAARPRPPTEHACWAKLLRLAAHAL